jgi:hypothetical protein
MKKNPSSTWFVLLASVAVVFGVILWWSRSGAADHRGDPVARVTPPGARSGRGGTGTPPTAAPSAAGANTSATRWRALREISSPAERGQALEDLAGALARHDPVGARELLTLILAEQGEGSPAAYAFVSAFASDYAAIDPAAAAGWAEFLPLSLRFGALTFAAQHWARTDPAAATAWAGALAEPSLRSAMLRRIGEELERTGEPGFAAAWARRLAGSADATQHTDAIARLWARGDMPAAFQWSLGIADPARQEAAVIAVAGVAAEQNPVAAADWVAKFPAGDLRNRAAAVAVARWAESDPESAVRWLAAIGDQRMLESNIHVVARRWLAKDRSRATEWIQTSPLPPALKEYLLLQGG